MRNERRGIAVLAEASATGLGQPHSLHPKIDPVRCLGCGACVMACPEGQILGIVNGKATLIEPSECIGHGACRTACPHGAITLVFGSETRGVEIPLVGADFQTNVPGLFIAGELGGMGLIRNAIEQGRQAIESIKQLERSRRPEVLDVFIVGGGPAGISASLAAIESGLRFITVEQESFGGTVSHFPRGKLVMTQPATLPIVGTVKFREISKEKLLAFWKSVAAKTGLKIQHGERVDRILHVDSGFEVTTNRARYLTRTVLLAIGRRGTPRRLGVPGEDQNKVVYRMVDAEQYKKKHVLVVGGGDTALEAAASLAQQTGTTVTISYRSEAFSRAKTRNRENVARAAQSGRLKVMLNSKVCRINPDSIEIDWQGQHVTVRNDAVIVCAGGILPTSFLKEIGVEVGVKYGTA